MRRTTAFLIPWFLSVCTASLGCGGQANQTPSRSDGGAGDGDASDSGESVRDAGDVANDAATAHDASREPPGDAAPTDAGGEVRVPGCGKAQQTGRRTLNFDVDGTQREVLVYVPSGYDGETPLPLTFNLHGSSGNPAGQMDYSGMEPLADQKGFIVAAMAGYGGLWNVARDPSKPDDVRFAEVILDWARDELCIDPARVFSTGYSGGGRTSSRLACALPDRIRAIAPVAGVRHDAPCDARNVAVLALHGTGDQTNFYGGCGETDTGCSRNGEWVEGVEAAVNDWRTANGCSDTPTVEPISDKIERRSFGACSGSPVVFYRVTDGTHVWQLLPNTTEVVLDFFLAQPRR